MADAEDKEPGQGKRAATENEAVEEEEEEKQEVEVKGEDQAEGQAGSCSEGDEVDLSAGADEQLDDETGMSHDTLPCNFPKK